MIKLSQTGYKNNLPLLRMTRKTLPYKNLRLGKPFWQKKNRWNVLTPMLCNKMCVRKLQYMYASEPTRMRTPYIWVYGFSHFEDSLSIGSLHLTGSYQDALEVLDIDRLFWDTRTPHTCACPWCMRTFARHLPTLAKIGCPLSVMVSCDKWIQAQWLSKESVHWSKLIGTRCSS